MKEFNKNFIWFTSLYLVIMMFIYYILSTQLPNLYPQPPYPAQAVGNLLSGFMSFTTILVVVFSAILTFFSGKRHPNVILVALLLILIGIMQFIWYYQIFSAWAYEGYKSGQVDLIEPTLAFWRFLMISFYAFALIFIFSTPPEEIENKAGIS